MENQNFDNGLKNLYKIADALYNQVELHGTTGQLFDDSVVDNNANDILSLMKGFYVDAMKLELAQYKVQRGTPENLMSKLYA